MATQGEERRKHIRIFLPGGQVRQVTGVLLALVGKVIDLSVNGVKFVGAAGFVVNDDMDLEVTLPSGAKFKCKARIIHLQPIPEKENEVIYGVQFVDLADDDRLELGQFIMKKRAEQDDILKEKLD